MSGVQSGYRFTIIPEWVLYHAELSALAVRLYGALARHGTDPASCYPSHARLAQLVGIDERSVARPLKALAEVGAIAVVRRPSRGGHRQTNGYQLAGDTPLPYRAAPRGERKPPNEIATYISPETQEAAARFTNHLKGRTS